MSAAIDGPGVAPCPAHAHLSWSRELWDAAGECTDCSRWGAEFIEKGFRAMTENLCECGHPENAHGAEWCSFVVRPNEQENWHDCPCATFRPRPAEATSNSTGPYTQTVHALNAEGHQVGCPRWGIPQTTPAPAADEPPEGHGPRKGEPASGVTVDGSPGAGVPTTGEGNASECPAHVSDVSERPSPVPDPVCDCGVGDFYGPGHWDNCPAFRPLTGSVKEPVQRGKYRNHSGVVMEVLHTASTLYDPPLSTLSDDIAVARADFGIIYFVTEKSLADAGYTLIDGAEA